MTARPSPSPRGLIVTLGTNAEFALPVLIVAGLFTRLAALGMLVFVAVQRLCRHRVPRC